MTITYLSDSIALVQATRQCAFTVYIRATFQPMTYLRSPASAMDAFRSHKTILTFTHLLRAILVQLLLTRFGKSTNQLSLSKALQLTWEDGIQPSTPKRCVQMKRRFIYRLALTSSRSIQQHGPAHLLQ